MKHLFLILILISSIVAKAQEIKKKRTWNVKTNVTSLIDILTFPTVQLAVGKRITEHVSVNVEAGNQFYKLTEVDSVILVQKGYKLNADCRYYFSHIFKNTKFERLKGIYIGAQGFYRNNQFTANALYYSTNDSLTIYETYFGVKKRVFGYNCIVGYELTLKNRFIFDWYVGLGYRDKKILNTHKEFDNKNIVYPHDLTFNSTYSNLSESSIKSVNALLGLRVGFIF